MVRHRCTGCKEDVGELGIRHKYAGGLFCEPCLRELGVRGGRVVVHGFWGGLFDLFRDIISGAVAVFSSVRPRLVEKDRAVKVAYSVMKNKARDMPPNACGTSPQMR